MAAPPSPPLAPGPAGGPDQEEEGFQVVRQARPPPVGVQADRVRARPQRRQVDQGHGRPVIRVELLHEARDLVGMAESGRLDDSGGRRAVGPRHDADHAMPLPPSDPASCSPTPVSSSMMTTAPARDSSPGCPTGGARTALSANRPMPVPARAPSKGRRWASAPFG